MPNIQFSYRYRDAANYKKHDRIIFANPQNIALSDLESFISSKLIDSIWFYVEEWGLPELFLDTCDFRYDPAWHEFESVEYTNDLPNSSIGLNEFIEAVNRTKQFSW